MTQQAWLTFGFVGQVAFTMRFLLQWVHSERAKKSVTPLGFWYWSLAGGVVLTIYAVHLGDPVFIIGQGAGIFIYLRNLQLIRRHRLAEAAPPQPPTD